MLEFKLNREIYGQAKRGTYIIFPLKYDIHLDLKSLEIEEAQSVNLIRLILQIYWYKSVKRKMDLFEDIF